MELVIGKKEILRKREELINVLIQFHCRIYIEREKERQRERLIMMTQKTDVNKLNQKWKEILRESKKLTELTMLIIFCKGDRQPCMDIGHGLHLLRSTLLHNTDKDTMNTE